MNVDDLVRYYLGTDYFNQFFDNRNRLFITYQKGYLELQEWVVDLDWCGQ